MEVTKTDYVSKKLCDRKDKTSILSLRSHSFLYPLIEIETISRHQK